MERFFSEDPENYNHFNFDQDDDDDEVDFENDMLIQTPDVVQVVHVDVDKNNVKNHILTKAIELAESSFFWRFRSLATKMDQIQLIYEHLKEMTADEEIEEEE